MRLSSLIALIIAAATAPVRGFAEPLPTDPRLVTGTLDNGLAYIVLQHDEPPDRVILRLHIDSGSLNETEQQLGVAHFLEHMAFNGSEHFPPGTVVPFFQEMGMAFGRHQNASTGFDRTFYMLELPDTKPETLARGMLFLRDVAFGLDLSDDEINAEREIIMEEKRTRESAQQRVVEQVITQLAPESIFGERLPIGTEETILGMDSADFRAYYDRWYVPSNMALIVVGDLPASQVIPLIEERFGTGPTLPRPRDAEIGVMESVGERAIIATDPEMSHAEISISRVSPPRGPTTTTDEFRRDLVESLASRMFNRRLRARAAAGELDALNASAGSSDFAGALRWTQISARGEAADWQAMLTQIAEELQRARLHGFTEQELADARADAQAAVDRAVEVEPTMSSRAFMSRIHNAVAIGEPPMSATQQRELVLAALPTITLDEVSETFASLFDFSEGAVFILQAPTAPDLPTEAELIRAGRDALAVTPEAEAEAARAESLLAKAPEGGELAWGVRHAESDVTTIHLTNGVIAHIRPMDVKEDSISVQIRIMGGTIEETADNRGVTDAASLAWGRAQAGGGLTSTQVRDLMVGSTASVRGRAGQDVLTLSISSNPDDLEDGFQLAHLLLTDPTVEGPALDQWKTGQKQLIEMRRSQPEIAAIRAYFDALFPPDDIRVRLLTEEQVDAITLEQAQAWLDRIIAEAPIEVAVVGDIEVEDAAALVIKYLGSLPSRPKVTPETNLALRTMARPEGPTTIERTIETRSDKAIVVAGFATIDYTDHEARRALALAARILSTRMIEQIREAEGLSYSPTASSQPATSFPGHGVFMSQSSTDPDKAARLADALHSLFADFAADGPTEDELATAKLQFANQFAEDTREPRWWLGAISDLAYLGVSLDEILREPLAYEDLTTEQVRETFAQHYRPENRFTIIIRPETPVENSDAGAAP
ncbi:MAG: M16 family metallopeptidase [Phycisphaerales bacterium JB039]